MKRSTFLGGGGVLSWFRRLVDKPTIVNQMTHFFFMLGLQEEEEEGRQAGG